MFTKTNIFHSLYALQLWLVICTTVFAHTPPSKKSIQFIPNKGQWDNDAVFSARIPGGHLFAEHNSIYFFLENNTDVAKAFKHPRKFREEFLPYSVRLHSVKIDFKGSIPNPTVLGTKQLETYYNYFLGDDAQFWKSDVKAYSGIHYKELYTGIDLHYYTDDAGQLKYDFVIAANANAQQIQLDYQGQTSLKLKKGLLYIETSVNNWVEQKPFAYQVINGQKNEVQCAYKRIAESNSIVFEIGEYNKELQLVIDPVLVFSSYSGSSVDNFGYTATYDNDGNLYAAGIARNATNFPNGKYPVTPGAFQQIWGGGVGSWPQNGFPSDISVSKYTPDGSNLIYATYLGGNLNDYPHSIVSDKNNNLVIFGSTLSKNFPTTVNAFDRTHNDSFDIFLTKLSANGTALMGSTYIGGAGIDGVNNADSLLINYADEFRGEVIIDGNNDILVATSTNSSNFPVTAGAIQTSKSGKQDGIIFKVDSTLKTLKASTYLGKENNDAIYSLDIAKDGTIYIAGGTQSNSQWFTGGVQVGSYNGGITDAFFARINNDLTNMQRFAFWGTSQYDQGYFIRISPLGNPVTFGQTYGRILRKNANYNVDSASLFITSFHPNFDSTTQSLTIGNKTINNTLSPSAFMVDECGTLYGSVWGGTVNRQSRFAQFTPSFISSTGSLPLTANALQTTTDGSDFYLFAIGKNFDSLLFATYYGENGNADHVDGGTSRFDKKGIIYQSVCASCDRGISGTFPTTPNSFSPTNFSPRCSNAILKLDFRASNVVNADFSFTPKTFCLDSYVVVNYTNSSFNGKQHFWYVNGLLRDTTFNFKDTIRNAGSYTIKLIEIDSSRCIIIDSAQRQFSTGVQSNASFTAIRDTCSAFVTFTNTSTPANANKIWYFGDGDTSSQQTIKRKFKNNGTYQILLITNPGTLCSDSAVFSFFYDSSSHIVKASYTPKDTAFCEPWLFQFLNTSNRSTSLKWFLNNTFVDSSFVFDTILIKGKYTLKLTVRDAASCNKIDSSSHSFTIYPEAFPEFDVARDSCSFTVRFINKTLLILGDTIQYFWRFGNGDSSMLQNPIIKFDTGGTYIITMIANKGLDCERTVIKKIHLDTPGTVLSANILVLPAEACTPASFTFTNQSVNAIRFAWFYNSVFVDSVNNTLTPTFTKDTIINVMLIASNTLTCAAKDTIVKTIQVRNGTKSGFSFFRDTCTGKVLFTNTSTSDNNEPLLYVWYFGDGSVSTEANPQHTYVNNGIFNVSLVTNPGTICSDSTVISIVYDTSEHILKAGFDLNRTTYCLPARVTAINTSLNDTFAEWYRNGILVSLNKNYVDSLLPAGSYKLTLLIRSKATCKKVDSISKNFTIFSSGNPNFSMARDSCSLVVSFINQSTNNGSTPLQYKWYFGDGDSSTENNPIHIYPKTDFYTVTLLTNPGSPCIDSFSQTYFFDGDTLMQIIIPNVFTPNGDGVNDCYEVSGISPKCDQFEITIYNRWGTPYFKSTDSKGCWNGKNGKGEDASPGVYFYILKYTKNVPVQIKKEVRGTVTLMRE